MKSQIKILLAVIFIWFVLYFDTLLSMVNIWWRSDTFAHGFLIFPISLYLIWEKRILFHSLSIKPNLFFYFILFGLSVLWMFSAVVDVQVVMQFSVIMMLPAIVGALFGIKTLKKFAFPLFFLLFAVPFGEFLIPKLQDITALITVWGLELTGIPVFQEGLYISIPSGDFEVAVACSGIRYLIASLALGVLYAYLTYHKLYKRIIFIVLALIIPIIANGIRAYGIVMIAHLSDMKYATGVDHLIYGWLFFGVVIFLLFLIGSFWRDEEIDDKSDATDEIKKEILLKSNIQQDRLISSGYFSLAMIIVLMLSGPIVHNIINLQEPQTIKEFGLNNESIGNWKLIKNQQSNWAPYFLGNDKEIKRDYVQGQKLISNYLAFYQSQTQNKELINHGNSAYHLKSNKLIARQQRQIMVAEQYLNINIYQLTNYKGQQQRLIIGWYYIFGQALINPVKIKIAQAIGKITGIAREGYYIAYAIDYTQDEVKAERDLLAFIKLHWPQLRQDIK